MKNIRFSGITAIFCLAMFFLCLSFSSGQDVPLTPATGNAPVPESAEPLKIKVSVEEVRLDVVVLDKKGEPVTDLTAADFEVFQDGKRQVITSSVYIDSQPDVPQNASNFLMQPAHTLKKEDVRRTILFLVDDYAMTLENGYYTKMALRNFIEKQMQPGDMISVLRTDYGNRALNMFLTDKREVIARINAIPSTMAPRPDIQSNAGGVGPAMYLNFLWRRYENQASTLSFGLHALENMPGRKILFMITPFSVPDDPLVFHDHMKSMYDIEIERVMRSPTYAPSSTDAAKAARYARLEADSESERERLGAKSVSAPPPVESLFEKLSDEALRAGVVVNYLDIDGLINYYADAQVWQADGLSFNGKETDPAEAIQKKLQNPNTMESLAVSALPAQTGGIYIRGSNFFLNGIGKDAESLMKGYYLISYVPPSDTFKTRGKKEDYRSLKVTVNRKDVAVHTRAGFFNRLENKPDADTPKNPLIDAIYSPFKEDDINVNIAAGYVKDDKAGYLVRSWIHLDPKDINIVEMGEGVGRADLEAVFVTSDVNGKILDSNRVEFTLTNVNTEWVKKHGIRFSMVLPVKKPGPYYIRIAVQDTESKRTGAAYQYLDIPDLKKKGLALSNIFMLTGADDLQWMNSDAKKEIGQGVFFPMLQAEEVKSPALRTYKAGDNLMTLSMLYNADAKAIRRSEIETQTILYKDGKEFLRGAPTAITPAQVETPGSIPLLNRFTVGANMPPGDYVLQILATDKKNSKKEEGNAAQFIGFTVTE